MQYENMFNFSVERKYLGGFKYSLQPSMACQAKKWVLFVFKNQVWSGNVFSKGKKSIKFGKNLPFFSLEFTFFLLLFSLENSEQGGGLHKLSHPEYASVSRCEEIKVHFRIPVIASSSTCYCWQSKQKPVAHIFSLGIYSPQNYYRVMLRKKIRAKSYSDGFEMIQFFKVGSASGLLSRVYPSKSPSIFICENNGISNKIIQYTRM